MSEAGQEGLIFPHPGAEEHRHDKRRKTFKVGEIVFDQKQCLMTCHVMDLSQHGARLRPEDPLQCPEAFVLHIKDGPAYLCEAVWRHGGHMGVKFTTKTDFDPSWHGPQ